MAGTDPDRLPSRPRIAGLYRRPLERLEHALPLPRVSPDLYSLLGLACSALVWLAPQAWQQALLVAAALLADWLDGATARRYSGATRRGYLTDVALDRAGEGLIFLAARATPVGQAFLALWILNCLLTVYSLRSGRHRILPLRFAYLVVLIVSAGWPRGAPAATHVSTWPGSSLIHQAISATPVTFSD